MNAKKRILRYLNVAKCVSMNINIFNKGVKNGYISNMDNI